jgi:hypothetical protein
MSVDQQASHTTSPKASPDLDARVAIDISYAATRDWQDIAQQVRNLPLEASPLSRVLSNAIFEANVASYKSDGEAASKAQDRHKRHATRAALFGLLAACLAGTILYMGLSPKTSALGLAAAALQGTFLAVAFYSAVVVSIQKPYRTWAEHRGQAEARRIRHFQMLLAADEPAGGNELQYKPLALEYVRAYLLEDQKAWFQRRSSDFTAEVKRRVRWQIFALSLVGIASAQMAAVAITTDPIRPFLPASFTSFVDSLFDLADLNAFVLLGLVGGALQTFVTCRAAISLADRNAATYGRMVDVISEILGKPLDDARRASISGDALTLERFWSTVSFELIGEQREWGAALSTAQLLTLDKLAGLSENAKA